MEEYTTAVAATDMTIREGDIIVIRVSDGMAIAHASPPAAKAPIVQEGQRRLSALSEGDIRAAKTREGKPRIRTRGARATKALMDHMREKILAVLERAGPDGMKVNSIVNKMRLTDELSRSRASRLIKRMHGWGELSLASGSKGKRFPAYRLPIQRLRKSTERRRPPSSNGSGESNVTPLAASPQD